MASSASMLRNALIVLSPAFWQHLRHWRMPTLTKQSPAANAEVAASPQALTLNFLKA